MINIEISASLNPFGMNEFDKIGNFYHNENYQKYMSYIKSKERRGDFKNINYNEYKRLAKRKNKLLKKHKKRKKKKGRKGKENKRTGRIR